MYLVTSVYKKSAEEIEKFLVPHRAFLDEYVRKGKILIAGRKVPGTGGVILAVGASKDEVAAMMSEDPFASEGIALYEITEFDPKRFAPDLEKFI